jgi:hypothetical protein
MAPTVIRKISLIGILLLLALASSQISIIRPASAAEPVSRQMPIDAYDTYGLTLPDAAVSICFSNKAPCQLRAIPSRARGTVSLSWRSNGVPFRGSFLVERSTNRLTWSAVSACRTTPTAATSYSCSDTGLNRGTIYYFRACAVTTGLRCGTLNVTPVTSVRAP